MMRCQNSNENYQGASLRERVKVINNTFAVDHGITGGDSLIALNNVFVNTTNIALKNVQPLDCADKPVLRQRYELLTVECQCGYYLAGDLLPKPDYEHELNE